MFKPHAHTVERPNQSTWIGEQNCEILPASKEYRRKITSASRGTPTAISKLLSVVFLVVLSMGQCQKIAKCNFEDTADFSRAHRFENGSYLYGNLIIPSDQVAIYDYLEVANGERIVYPPHPRGCVCQEKNCVKFCCHPTKEILSSSGQCLALKQELLYNSEINVIFRNGSAAHQNALKDFTVIHSQPCANAYPLFPEVSKDDEWDMFENGDMMLRHYRISITKRDYCLTPYQMSEDSWSLIAMNCPISNTLSTSARIFNLGALMSTALMSLVVIIYLSIPEHGNVLGKSIAACLFSMIAGNLILCTISLTEITFPQLMCSSMGYIAYFFYESGYIWLAVIAYSLWQTKRQQMVSIVLDNDSTCNTISERSNYIKNLIYALGIPLCFTAALMLIQGSNIDEAYKPGIGVEYCWLDVHIWPALPYFFGLNGLILVCCIIFLALSGESPEYDEYDDEKPIVQEKSDLYKPQTQLPFIEDHKKMKHIVLQLFLIFAISWFWNVAAYLSEMLEHESKPIMLFISDCMNFIEGPLVFYVLVLRPKVMSLLKHRSHPEAV